MNHGQRRIRYIIGTCGACVASVILFTGFFVTGQGGILDTYLSQPQKDVSSAAYLPTQSQTASNEQMIETYRQYLQSENLILVNKENACPDGYTPELTDVPDTSIQLQPEAAAQLQAFLAAADAEGIQYTVMSGYRSAEQQQALYDEEYKKNQAAGYSGEETLAAKTKLNVAPAGYSEHQTGLAVDVGEPDTKAVTAAIETNFYKFALENAYQYGFILRYPENKRESTGYDIKPWHLRYIGDPAQAKYIMDKKISLEEYIEYLQKKIADYQAEIEADNNKIIVSQ